jgi:hypothetical protein
VDTLFEHIQCLVREIQQPPQLRHLLKSTYLVVILTQMLKHYKGEMVVHHFGEVAEWEEMEMIQMQGIVGWYMVQGEEVQDIKTPEEMVHPESF